MMSRFPSAPGRRRALARLLQCALLPLFAGRAAAQPAATREVVVLTSYPEEMMSRFEAAFERAHPEYRLRLQWRRGSEALALLSEPGQGGVDVYWTPSPRSFARLKTAGAFQPAAVDRSGLPERLGGSLLSDPDGHYLATELASFGFVFDAAALEREHLLVPQDWTELADVRLARRIALPNPGRVGFAPPMVEIVLQGWGWERGWALWSEIAGLAFFVNVGARSIAAEVEAGRAVIGVSMDFFINAAIAGGSKLSFAYPRHNGVNPAHVAITASAANVAGARAFVAFLLSPQGQQLLADADIRKLPVRPQVYADLPAGYHDPFAAAEHGAYGFDGELARERAPVVAALFEQMFVQGHERFAELWARVHAAESAGRDVGAIRSRLCAVPLTEEGALAPALVQAFRDRDGGVDDRVTRVQVDWQWAAALARSEAARMLDEAGA